MNHFQSDQFKFGHFQNQEKEKEKTVIFMTRDYSDKGAKIP
jgi:hypothetical protein